MIEEEEAEETCGDVNYMSQRVNWTTNDNVSHRRMKANWSSQECLSMNDVWVRGTRMMIRIKNPARAGR